MSRAAAFSNRETRFLPLAGIKFGGIKTRVLSLPGRATRFSCQVLGDSAPSPHVSQLFPWVFLPLRRDHAMTRCHRIWSRDHHQHPRRRFFHPVVSHSARCSSAGDSDQPCFPAHTSATRWAAWWEIAGPARALAAASALTCSEEASPWCWSAAPCQRSGSVSEIGSGMGPSVVGSSRL